MLRKFFKRHNPDGMFVRQQINKTELCISCGVDTRVPVALDIQKRLYYIEGAGQLCRDCYDELYPEPIRSSYNELD